MSGVLLAASIGARLSVTLDPAEASTGGTVGGHVRSMTAIPAGGSGAYTYAWTVTTPDPNYGLTINSPAAATTDFDFDAVGDGRFAHATVRCTITDTGTGLTAYAEGIVRFVNRSTA